jgi:hypothetical protein
MWVIIVSPATSLRNCYMACVTRSFFRLCGYRFRFLRSRFRFHLLLTSSFRYCAFHRPRSRGALAPMIGGMALGFGLSGEVAHDFAAQ